jgi:hypothetical protein
VELRAEILMEVAGDEWKSLFTENTEKNVENTEDEQ